MQRSNWIFLRCIRTFNFANKNATLLPDMLQGIIFRHNLNVLLPLGLPINLGPKQQLSTEALKKLDKLAEKFVQPEQTKDAANEMLEKIG